MFKVTENAPNFTMQALVGDETKDIKLKDFRGKWLVMFFYTGDATVVCPNEITSFRDSYDQFKKLDAELLAVSVDSIEAHKTLAGDIGIMPFPWGSDIDRKVSRDYNVLLEEKGIAMRGLFIIDPEGVVRYQLVQEPTVGRSVDEILRVMEAFHTGEICPVNWKPGEKTLS